MLGLPSRYETLIPRLDQGFPSGECSPLLLLTSIFDFASFDLLALLQIRWTLKFPTPPQGLLIQMLMVEIYLRVGEIQFVTWVAEQLQPMTASLPRLFCHS